MKDFFSGVVPEDANWMSFYSELVDGSNVTPVNNLVGNTLFMKVNGESGGAFGNSEAFEELYIPHIADDTNNPDPNKRYWWTGLTLNNPNPTFAPPGPKTEKNAPKPLYFTN